MSHVYTMAFSVWPPPPVFWPYFAASVVLIIGLPTARQRTAGQPFTAYSIVEYGPVFFAIATAIFGADHFIYSNFVRSVVPPWMPWRLFWVYFVGTALLLASLSFAARRCTRLSASLLGLMIFLFVLLIFVPLCWAVPSDRTRFTLLMRDSTLSWGVLAFAASQFKAENPRVAGAMIAVSRVIMGMVVTVYGVEQFLYPRVAPGIPQDDPTFALSMAAWIPAHVVWAYLTGAIFVVCGLALLTRKQPRMAAVTLGWTVLVLMLVVYLPLVVARPADINGRLNYFAIHSALAGAFLLLAKALPAVQEAEVAVAQPSLHPAES